MERSWSEGEPGGGAAFVLALDFPSTRRTFTLEGVPA
jgi:hypothetical protein